MEQNGANPSSQTNPRKRKLQMDAGECLDFSSQEEGALPLTNPQAVPVSSKDPNRGMYPRPSRVKGTGSEGMKQHGFMPAGDLLRPNNDYMQAAFSQNAQAGPSSSQTSRDSNSAKHKAKNPISSYFKPKPLEVSATVSRVPQLEDDDSNASTSCSQPLPDDDSNASTPISQPLPDDSNASTSCPQPLPLVPTCSMCSRDCDSDSSDVVCLDSPAKKRKASIVKSPTRDPAIQKLFDGQKQKEAKDKEKKSRKKPKKEPRFNRDNAFLYSKGPSLPRSSLASCSKDSYGLCGSGNYPKDEELVASQGVMSYLPPELLENILCRLPIMDLLLNASCVCREWYDIIMDEQFLHWKKKYSMVKKKQDEFSKIVNIMQANGMTTFPSYLKGLVSYMRTFKPVTAGNMNDCLRQHSLYGICDSVIRDKLPECVVNDVVNPWSMITCMVVMSEKVGQISEIIRCLLSTYSDCTAMEVTECLYCIATFLYVFKLQKLQEVWTGMHYRVYYALYLYENDSNSCPGDLTQSMAEYSGQQSLTRYGNDAKASRLTHEQLRICKYNVVPNDLVKIIAFAGTGKTTTLVQYTQMRPSQRFLLVVYNKSVCDHAKTQFPTTNVECRTGHSLAYRKYGLRYKPKLGNLRVYDVTQALPARKGLNLFLRAKFVVDTITAFTNSADDFVTTAHVPTHDGENRPIPHDQRMNLVDDAELIWAKMKDLHDKRVRMTHDGYLKLYCLSRPELITDVILIDEAQDLTPAVSDMLMRQSQPKILVGDPHQQIYAFRGAINAMQTVNATHTFYLTQSFRFGPEIASVAASLLEFLKGEKKKVLVGNGKPGGVDGSIDGQVAIITRSNFTLFTKAVEKCVYSTDCRWVAFVGGTENFGFDKLMDIYTLMLPEDERRKKNLEVRDFFYKKFPNIGALEQFATKANDNELMGKIRIVKAYGDQLPGHICKIRAKCVSDIRRADIVFSTAHKAKGLEFDTVYLTDDYLTHHPTLSNIGGMAVAMCDNSMDSSNVLYVAATRAKKRLLLTPTLMQLLQCSGERFIYPVESKCLELDKVPFKCIETDQEFTPLPATLVKRKITLSSGKVMPHGLYSPVMVHECCSSLSALIGPAQPAECRGSVAAEEEPVDEEAEWEAEMQFAVEQDLQFMF